MRITALTIENFKGISSPVRIEFKPITLLFGPNSAGKSTIVQALHYIREILERGNVDADRILGADESFNLGGFVNFVHNHDLSRTIRLKVEFDIDSETLSPFFTIEKGQGVDIYKVLGFDGQSIDGSFCDINESVDLSSAWVDLSVSWSQFLGRPILSQYETGFDGHSFATIVCAEDGKHIRINHINYQHPLFSNENWLLGRDDADYSLFESLLEAVIGDEYSGVNGDVNLLLGNQATVLPNWGKPLLIAHQCLKERRDDDTLENLQFSIQQLVGYLSQLIVSPGQVLLDKLESAKYIGPIRKVPSRNHNPVRSEDSSRWSSGLAAWDRLHLGDPEFVSEVSDWLSRSERLDAGYMLELRRYKEIEVDSPLYISLTTGRFLDEDEDRFGELASLKERRELMLVDDERFVQVFPQDVGVGISQLLPVVVGALDDAIEILMVEQPELHIHPGLQCRIGDLLINQIQDGEKIFIIETHSEHLLLRLLKRIREKYEGELPPGLHGLSPDQLSVNYLELHDEEGMCISQLQVSEEGDSLGEWPQGFFAERAAEMF